MSRRSCSSSLINVSRFSGWRANAFTSAGLGRRLRGSSGVDSGFVRGSRIDVLNCCICRSFVTLVSRGRRSNGGCRGSNLV